MMDVRDWIATHANRTPDALAQIDHATGRRFTYAEMHERVARIAGHLRETVGIGVGDVVAVLGNNSSDMLDIDFACGRIGAIFLPMNTRLAAPEIAFQLDDARPRVLFVGDGFDAIASEAVDQADVTPTTVRFGTKASEPNLESLIREAPRLVAVERREPEDGWTLIYSSGTTGRPKGILHTHGGVTMQACGNAVPLGLGRRACNLTILPLFHISGLNVFAHAVFYAGGTQVTMERFDPLEVLRVLSDPAYGVTHFTGVPTMFEMMAQLPGFGAADLGSVEGAFVGGAPSTEALLRTYADKGMPLMQGYGLTESGPTLTVLDAEDGIRKIGSAGKPMMHVDLRVVRPDGSDAASDEIGEILARGPSVITAYFRRPEAQQTSFEGGWLRTGDMGYLDDEGFLFISDRKNDMFISGGENVYPAEVENCIAAVDGVAQVSVIGVADEKWGEVGAACVVLRADAALTADEIIAACNGRIARYKIPKHVYFLDALPIGGTGKVLKRALRAQLGQD
ncbi:MAG: long-chain fatty acid--CoA ligase [Pseudomonadota bacterium]